MTIAGCLAVAAAAGAVVACGSDPALNATGTTAPDQSEDFEATAEDFTNINDMTAVRGFFVDNRLGYLDEAIAIAEANEGGVYPVGTIIQLVPQEAMIKRRSGWNPATNDWEFFFLDVTPEGTTILTRGADEVVNRFGGNCAECHQAAEPQFDLVCEDDHGCEPLPIGDDVIEGIQEADPRPLAS
jgi:hypothetical protein